MKKRSRREYDFYPTPYENIDDMFCVFEFGESGRFLEPCEGDGRIRHFFQEVNEGWICEGNDIQNGGQDFIGSLYQPDHCDLIITNPPYSLALEFIEKGLEVSDSSLWLVRLGFLASRKRKGFFTRNPPDTLLILSARPSFTGDGRTDSSDYCWLGWNMAKYRSGEVATATWI